MELFFDLRSPRIVFNADPNEPLPPNKVRIYPRKTTKDDYPPLTLNSFRSNYLHISRKNNYSFFPKREYYNLAKIYSQRKKAEKNIHINYKSIKKNIKVIFIYYGDFQEKEIDILINILVKENIDEIYEREIKILRKENGGKRIIARTKLLKEELVAAAWHPNRVQKWLDAGYEIDDM